MGERKSSEKLDNQDGRRVREFKRILRDSIEDMLKDDNISSLINESSNDVGKVILQNVKDAVYKSLDDLVNTPSLGVLLACDKMEETLIAKDNNMLKCGVECKKMEDGLKSALHELWDKQRDDIAALKKMEVDYDEKLSHVAADLDLLRDMLVNEEGAYRDLL